MNKLLTFAALLALSCAPAMACTSMIVSAEASATGRPLLWKHRDTGCLDNFVERVAATDTTPAYVGLFNAPDSALAEAWMGFNEWGFAIMNTASYNLAPDTAAYKDREAEVMTRALRTCRTVADFDSLLRVLPRPMGIQANFGVIDAEGNGAYFEANDEQFTRYNLQDAPGGVLVRTNFSMSGNDTDGMGYIRYRNVYDLLGPKLTGAEKIHPSDLTECLSRTFYNSLLNKNYSDSSRPEGGERWAIDRDFIPRAISSASCVVEGISPGEDPALTIMWTALGYPPATPVRPVTVDSVPDELRPLQPGHHALAADRANAIKQRAFPIERGSGPNYIDLEYLRPVVARMMAESRQAYIEGYETRRKRAAQSER